MAFRIRNNYEADVALTNLYMNRTKLSKLEQQLSTGLRIVRAADDASDLFIADYMKHTYVGLQRATKNAQYGLSAARIADDALGRIYDILVKIKDKVVEAANARTKDERVQIQTQINEYVRNIQQIVKQTEFDGKKLLDGQSFTVQFGSHKDQYLIFNGTTDVMGSASAAGAAKIVASAGSIGSKQAVIKITKEVKEKDTLGGEFTVSLATASAFTINVVGSDSTATSSGGGNYSATIQQSLENIEKLMTAVDRLRGYYAGIENKLENIIENNQVMVDNFKEAESIVRNVDYASAFAEFQKTRLITQANVAALAQANQIPQLVQQLMR